MLAGNGIVFLRAGLPFAGNIGAIVRSRRGATIAGVGEFEGLLRDALAVTALLTIPILAVATLVGATVAILQAATQIQEQTLTLLPKVLAVGLTAALFGRFGMSLCEQLLREAVERIPQLVRG